MNTTISYLDVKGELKEEEIVITPEEKKRMAQAAEVLEIVKNFDELKMKFNDCLSFEAQATRETDEDTKENLENIFKARTKKLFAFHYMLEEKMKKRLSANIA